MRTTLFTVISITFVALVTGCTEDLDDTAEEASNLVEPVAKSGAAAGIVEIIGTVGTTTCTAPKVLVCHIPPGNPDNAHAICVGASAVAPHVANHGDTVGSCSSTREVQPVCRPFGTECSVDGDCCSDACSKNVCIDRI